jgi:hypothetical protein
MFQCNPYSVLYKGKEGTYFQQPRLAGRRHGKKSSSGLRLYTGGLAAAWQHAAHPLLANVTVVEFHPRTSVSIRKEKQKNPPSPFPFWDKDYMGGFRGHDCPFMLG